MREVTVTFDDGSQHVYRGVPDAVTPEQITARAQSEFKKTVTSLDGGRPAAQPSQAEAPAEQARVAPETQATRDVGRAQILQTELSVAEQRARQGDERAAADAAALRREMSTLPAPPTAGGGRGMINPPLVGQPQPTFPTTGQMASAQPAQLAQPAQPARQAQAPQGFFASIAEMVTGAQRSQDPEVSSALQENRTIYDMPESNRLSLGLLKAAAGGLLASPREKAQIFEANFPGTTTRVNQQGVVFLRSPTDGKEYVIPPGFRMEDIPGVVGATAAFTPAGRATTIPRAVLGAGATQAAIEAGQAAAGGQFSPEETAIAAALGPVGQVVQRGAQMVRRPAAPVTPRVEPTFPEAQVTPPVTPPITPSAATPTAAPAAGPTPFAATITPAEVSDVLSLARKASGFGPGSSTAKAKLIELAQVNPEARDAAARLNLDVPFDVLSDSPQVRNAVGLTRALVGSETEAAWEGTVRQVIQRADELSQQFDAAFIAGRPAPGATSQRILDNLKATREGLKAEAKTLYDRINGTESVSGLVPKATVVDLSNLRNTISTITQEVGEGGLSAQEKKLRALIEGGDVTYGRLLREKDLIGAAIGGNKSPYDNMSSASLKRLYGALAQDQLDNVGNIAGEEVRRELRAANLLTAKQKALEKRIVGAFGQEIDGSVATKMQTAISTAADKGDAAAFNKLMKVVPDELKKETLATALAAVTAGKAAGKAGAEEAVFSPAQYTKVYRGLRANPPVYAEMVRIMGPEWDRVSRDLYEVSRRIADAQSRIPVTGKANQIIGEASVQGLIGKVMNTGLAQRAVLASTGAAPGLGAFAPEITAFMQGGNKEAVKKAAELFASPQFQQLAVEAATQAGSPSQSALRRAASSTAFARFANAIGAPRDLDSRVLWLQNAIQTGRESAPQE